MSNGLKLMELSIHGSVFCGNNHGNKFDLNKEYEHTSQALSQSTLISYMAMHIWRFLCFDIVEISLLQYFIAVKLRAHSSSAMQCNAMLYQVVKFIEFGH